MFVRDCHFCGGMPAGVPAARNAQGTLAWKEVKKCKFSLILLSFLTLSVRKELSTDSKVWILFDSQVARIPSHVHNLVRD